MSTESAWFQIPDYGLSVLPVHIMLGPKQLRARLMSHHRSKLLVFVLGGEPVRQQ